MRIYNSSITNNAVIDLENDWASEPFWLGHIANYAVQLAYSDTPTGVFKIQVSCDKGIHNSNGPDIGSGVTHWTDLPDSELTVTANGTYMMNIPEAGYNWFRVIWTADALAASGQLDSARVNAKGI